MKYPDNTTAKIGDLIWWNEGVCIGHIQNIIDDEVGYDYWSLDHEPHAFLNTKHPFDINEIGIPHEESCFEDEGIGKLTSAERVDLRNAIEFAKTKSTHNFSNYSYTISTRSEGCEMLEYIFEIFDKGIKLEEIIVPYNQQPKS